MITNAATRPARQSMAFRIALPVLALVFLAPFFLMLSAGVRNDWYAELHPGELLPRAQYVKRPNGEWREVLGIETPFHGKADPLHIRARIGNWSGTVDKWVTIRENELVTRTGPTPRNFVLALRAHRFEFSLLRTLLTCLIYALAVTFSSALVGYSFLVLRWPGRDWLFYAALATMLVPASLSVVPAYWFYHTFDWQDGALPSVLPAFFGNAFLIYLLRRCFLRIPRDLIDAARIEGSSEWQIFTGVALPLSRPGLLLAATLAFIWQWSDAMKSIGYYSGVLEYYAAVVENPHWFGLSQLQQGTIAGRGEIMAMALLMIVPPALLVFLARKPIFTGINTLLPKRLSP